MRTWRWSLSLLLWIWVVVGNSSLLLLADSFLAATPVSSAKEAVKQTAETSKDHDRTCASAMSSETAVKKYEQDGAEAREIAAYLPYFPFKGIPRFYDIGGFLYEPKVFQRIVDIFADRYREIGIDVIAG
jgi:anionic cell wall polymer biosynthesis LytR-Cps2A-Psr (LCP) family protein